MNPQSRFYDNVRLRRVADGKAALLLERSLRRRCRFWGVGGQWRYVARLCATGPECSPEDGTRSSMDGLAGGTCSSVREPAVWPRSGSLQQHNHKVWRGPGIGRLEPQLWRHSAEPLTATTSGLVQPPQL